jgi:hypothetical protein
MPETGKERSGEYVFVEHDYWDGERSYTFYDDEETVARWKKHYEEWGQQVSEHPPHLQRLYEEGRPTDVRTRLICRSIR